MDMTPAAVALQVLTFFKRRCRADLFPEVFTISSQDPAARRAPALFCPLTSGNARRKTPRMLVKDDITRKLQVAFAPDSVEVIDESDQHHGHAGHRPGGQTHFRVYIVSKAFAGKSRLERHRMINQALAANLAGGVHALAIHADAPGEHTR
jgi:BolA family transcriptional regulator, general stress-responsive regulator